MLPPMVTPSARMVAAPALLIDDRAEHDGLRAELRGERVEQLGVASGQDERGSPLLQVPGDGGAEAAAGSRDEDGRSLDLHGGRP